MKRVVSVSLGSSTRNKTVEIILMGEKISIQRIGTDGNEKSAKKLFEELDGKVDALGVGGIDLTVGTLSHSFPIRAACKLIENVRNTPVVDGRGLKHTLEYKAVQYMTDIIGSEINPKRAMVTSALDRYGMALGFVDAGYDLTFCDFMFGLNIPVPVKSMKYEDFLISLMAPVVSRLPIKYLYPTGAKQLERIPRFKKWYDWATVVAGDSIYILKHMPDSLRGKVIFTNTTTVDDYETFRKAGVKYLVTTTPRYDGRSFGTNVLEAALIAVSGKKRLLDTDELSEMIAILNLNPNIEKLY